MFIKSLLAVMLVSTAASADRVIMSTQPCPDPNATYAWEISEDGVYQGQYFSLDPVYSPDLEFTGQVTVRVKVWCYGQYTDWSQYGLAKPYEVNTPVVAIP